MNKHIEVTLKDQIDRYKLIDISVDDFIDIYLIKLGHSHVHDISESEYEAHKKFELRMNVEDRFEVEHYTLNNQNKQNHP